MVGIQEYSHGSLCSTRTEHQSCILEENKMHPTWLTVWVSLCIGWVLGLFFMYIFYERRE